MNLIKSCCVAGWLYFRTFNVGGVLFELRRGAYFLRNKVQRNGQAECGALQAPVCKIHINGRLHRQIGFAQQRRPCPTCIARPAPLFVPSTARRTCACTPRPSRIAQRPWYTSSAPDLPYASKTPRGDPAAPVPILFVAARAVGRKQILTSSS